MNNIEDLKPKSIASNVLFIILFSIFFVKNAYDVYLNNMEFNFNAFTTILDFVLIILNVKDLTNKKKHNRELEQLNH
ncbi:Uncharacterised protein [[Clostridium] sordellii]|uniref:hypothetical protein n=1 Tax=Paraclostridium sordellii TaxID=1505 RepID=UPI0005DC7B86|nr:hypothetical protein [Paeniclostridium sordellii]MDU4415299.1 hypothetical protein [Paeniclostridium sordellii]MRZ28622.1 hypothetical protein [Paeniclostridium sordellii]CEN23655.1 Uncharacterised protein [[Clostridium] sordellii] [Paeniclostridium sordellii]CEP94230.1 Uncharacterised protein [[Clostridium] sordellii] [Paeniclostridium sordellii]CEQ07466.1 Uncharacterised protein [[Clostridium] sordellii] [Paeniclostridium sordellii]